MARAFDTDLQHFAEEAHVHGAVVPPIFQNSLFVFDSLEQFQSEMEAGSTEPGRHVYSRITNPTLEVVERKIARLEGAESAKVFASGMGAISSAIMSCVAQGAHVVCVDTAYGPTMQFLRDYLPRFGVATTFVEGSCVDEVMDAFRPETTLLYLESPSSILFKFQDFETLCRLAHERGASVAADNSYASPVYQNPTRFGVDLVLHSASKYLGGHSDIVAGALATSRERMSRILRDEVALYGAALAPFPAWLMLRGMRTLAVRMRAHRETGDVVASWLSGRAEVERVFHASDPAHPQRDLFLKQMTGSSGLLSFLPAFQDRERVRRFVEGLEVFQLGVSWGGFESLVVPLQMQPIGWDEQRWVIRLHCGLEDVGDLVADLDRAFDRAR
jgi:cystathionine beta-lyase/cystathionine gamma-synthase